MIFGVIVEKIGDRKVIIFGVIIYVVGLILFVGVMLLI